ncbi:MAG: family 16 glycosylhydrolase [Anaerolineaceae bacterium]|nr:family 16 glycosylhydrolase [Anaerolineaceae bacterium]
MNATFRRLCSTAAVGICLGLLTVGCADQGNATPGGTLQRDASAPAGKSVAKAAQDAGSATDAKPGAAAEAGAKAPSPFAATPAFEDNFDAGWEKRQTQWRVATWKQNGTLMAPERCATDGKGNMVQTILPGEPYRGGSMQTAKEYPYGRWVARVKPSPVPGALNTVFTKDWDDLTTPDTEGDGTGFEVDIELLTYTFGPGRGKVHLAIHAKNMKSWSEDLPLDFNPSDDFHEWGFDIYPDRVEWHVDGKHLKTWTAPKDKPIPAGGHEFFFNSWTKSKWIKGPPKEAAHYQIDWVRFYPLVTK